MKKYIFIGIILILLNMASWPESLVLKQKYNTIPKDCETIYDCNSAVNISFPVELSKLVEINTLKLFLNNVDITKKSSFHSNAINYLPIMPLSEGKNTAKITGVDIKGEKFNIEWTFSVKPLNYTIMSVEHDAKGTLIANEVITVKLRGRQSGTAYFDIGNKIRNVPMKELTPGIYSGSYMVKVIDNLSNEAVTGHLKFNSQLESSLTSDNKVNIRGDLFLIKILSPKPDEKVAEFFEIIGMTKPFAQILVSSVVWLKNVPIVNDFKLTTGGYEAIANKNGLFKMKYGIPLKFKDSTFTLRFLAKDEKGNYSIPTTITLMQK